MIAASITTSMKGCAMARIRIEDDRVRLRPGHSPEIDLVIGRAAAGRCVFHCQPPVERATRDEEAGFVELHFDLADYDRVLGLLSRERLVWMGEDLGLEG